MRGPRRHRRGQAGAHGLEQVAARGPVSGAMGRRAGGPGEERARDAVHEPREPGAADDLLTTLLLCAECPLILAPAMNAAMWAKPAVQRNVARVAADGARIVPPGSGWLSCRQSGVGRMAEPTEIAAVIRAVLGGADRTRGGPSPS